MKSLFGIYKDSISRLKVDNISKKTILTPEFLVESTTKFNIYYAPHNEYLNAKARILIVGICPGWAQTKIAYETAKQGIDENKGNEEILKSCKLTARFAGSMRKNLISMLDELNISAYYKIESASDLFNNNELLHTTSLIHIQYF